MNTRRIAEQLMNCTEEEFAEIFVIFNKMQKVQQSGENYYMADIEQDDFLGFNAYAFSKHLGLVLKEIIGCDLDAWWNKEEVITYRVVNNRGTTICFTDDKDYAYQIYNDCCQEAAMNYYDLDYEIIEDKEYRDREDNPKYRVVDQDGELYLATNDEFQANAYLNELKINAANLGIEVKYRIEYAEPAALKSKGQLFEAVKQDDRKRGYSDAIRNAFIGNFISVEAANALLEQFNDDTKEYEAAVSVSR